MNRIFGRGKPKEPAPNMSDMITKVSHPSCCSLEEIASEINLILG